MVVIAIAGGTGNIGRAITETFTQSNKHQVITLGRKASTPSQGIWRSSSSNQVGNNSPSLVQRMYPVMW